MKKDLDRLMMDRAIDALAVSGVPRKSSDLFYLTGMISVTGCWLIKKRHAAPFLVVGAMERDEAKKSGLRVLTWDDFDMRRLAKEARDPLEAKVLALSRMFESEGVAGNVAFFGSGDIPYAHALLGALSKSSAINVVVQPFNSVFSEARMTKDDSEIARIESTSRRAQEVMAVIRAFLASCRRGKDSALSDCDGRAVTIGRIKAMIDVETRTRGMEHEEEVIFSQGYDAAVPHSHGANEEALVTGQTIIFDYTPRDVESGLYVDITRTWCLGAVPAEIQALYDQVLEVHNEVLDALEVGKPCAELDTLTNEAFARQGHPTPLSGQSPTEGYVHSLGHGFGLNIHERPMLSVFSKTEERLAPGFVFTVEPGLYYPERKMGVRLEDDIAVKEDGTIVNLTSFSKELLVRLEPEP